MIIMENQGGDKSPWGNGKGDGNPWGSSGGGNNTGGGGRHSGGKGGGGGNGGGNEPPDFDELFRKGQDHLRKIMPDNKGSGGLFGLLIGLAIIAWLLSGFYRVESDQLGVELTFGEWTNRGNPSQPGLHYHYPYPIGSIEKPTVTRENRTVIGMDGAVNVSRNRNMSDTISENLMLTGDENIVEINFAVYWRIGDPGAFLFNVQMPELAVARGGESVMRDIIGQYPIIAPLSEKKEEIQQIARERLQELMDRYETGVAVLNVELLGVQPPAPVIDAFNDVQRARAEQEQSRNRAEAYRNAILPRARGNVEQLRQQAEAYREEVVSIATGDAARFTSVYEAYRQSPNVTQKRLYLETMEEVLSKSNKIILDNKAGGSGIVPYLSLQELQKRKPQQASQ